MLETLECGGNVTEVDAQFPPPLSAGHSVDEELVQAHKNLQLEISSQVFPPVHPACKCPRALSQPLLPA